MKSINKIFINAVLNGMASTVEPASKNKYAYPHSSDMSAMRSDWLRVGGDIKTVIKRENVKTAA